MKRLLRDLVIVVGVLGVGAFALRWFGVRRPTPESGRPLGGRQFAVSHAARPQSEVSVGVDPLDPRVLVAGSNDEHCGVEASRIYASAPSSGDHRRRASCSTTSRPLRAARLLRAAIAVGSTSSGPGSCATAVCRR